MHKSDSQFQIINQCLEEVIEDPLYYQEVDYDRPEWDNIPMILPRYCIHISKHLESLTNHYREKCSEETTQDLRESLTKEINYLQIQIDQEKVQRDEEKKQLQAQVTQQRQDFQALLKKLEDDKLYSIRKAKGELTKAFIKNDLEASTLDFESVRFPKPDMDKDLHTLVEPRQFSLLQIRDLFFSLLHISKFREDFWHHQEFFIKIKTEISQQIADFTERGVQQGLVNSNIYEKIASSNTGFSDHVKEYYRILEQDHDQVTSLFNKQKMILRELEDNKGFQDMVNGKFEKILYRINSAHDKTEQKLDHQKSKIEQQSKDFDKKLFELKEVMINNLDVAKHHMYDQIDYTKEQLAQQQKTEIDQLQFKMDEGVKAMEEKIQVVNKQSKQKIAKIKEICSNFFKNYEDSLKHLKNQFIEVHDAFQAWNRNVIRPNEIKEATLYSLEQRMKNEEIQRINDSILIKDIINKIIYSFHQHMNNTSKYLNGEATAKYDDLVADFEKSPNREDQVSTPGKQSVFQKLQMQKSNSPMRKDIRRNSKLNNTQQSTAAEIQAKKNQEEFNQLKAAELLLIKRLLFLRQKLSSTNEKLLESLNLEEMNNTHKIKLIADDSFNILTKFKDYKKKHQSTKFVTSMQNSPRRNQQFNSTSSTNLQPLIAKNKRLSRKDLNNSVMNFSNASKDQSSRLQKLKDVSVAKFETNRFISEGDLIKEDQKLKEIRENSRSKMRLKNLDYFSQADNPNQEK